MNDPLLLLAHLVLLHFADPVVIYLFIYLFLQIEDLLQSWIKQVYFPTEFAYVVLLCNILVTLKIFQTFKVLLYVLWWSVIFDVTIVIVWGHHELYLYKMANFIDKCCACSDCSNNQLFPHLPLYSGLSISWEQQYWN